MPRGQDTEGEILSCYWLPEEEQRGQSEDLIFLGMFVLSGSAHRERGRDNFPFLVYSFNLRI